MDWVEWIKLGVSILTLLLAGWVAWRQRTLETSMHRVKRAVDHQFGRYERIIEVTREAIRNLSMVGFVFDAMTENQAGEVEFNASVLGDLNFAELRVSGAVAGRELKAVIGSVNDKILNDLYEELQKQGAAREEAILNFNAEATKDILNGATEVLVKIMERCYTLMADGK